MHSDTLILVWTGENWRQERSEPTHYLHRYVHRGVWLCWPAQCWPTWYPWWRTA